ncbi:DUF427 domain-containing protein [Teichococcus vastitatis]|uniref:DUF427 domain-containing protein n=1 Tax=Teichococcus vastitatis TaxID=2307076 RepID=A0ABS9W7C9_9PROT|nr:DUF427 domain-containing protein [Pseudoroseomonas vastitatis]MCI0755202.1 DUF427 domain-containing protein [Pseudoroseomonas vastitatis]
MAQPDKPAATGIRIEPSPDRVVVSAAGRTVADSCAALILREPGRPAVFYLPREDAEMALLRRTAERSHCPYKGEASYFSIPHAGRSAENAVWSYEAPLEAVAAIRGHLAFYPERVDSIAVQPRRDAAAHY